MEQFITRNCQAIEERATTTKRKRTNSNVMNAVKDSNNAAVFKNINTYTAMNDNLNKEFKNRGILQRHILTHSNQRQFKCDECDQEFNRRDLLREYKCIHEEERQFLCDQCDNGFKKSGNLKAHKLTHTVLKPFVYDQCGSKFNRNSNLKVHKKCITVLLKGYMLQ
uniref:C2H2-type domain-containing protein n=1 Tax=Elaeophora elaphi TaxID=1147741 RepID=A0A0R3RJW2_9BILA